MSEFVTVNSINWEDRTFKAKPEPSGGNSCTGCVFRSFDGECRRPEELRLYTCLSTCGQITKVSSGGRKADMTGRSCTNNKP